MFGSLFFPLWRLLKDSKSGGSGTVSLFKLWEWTTASGAWNCRQTVLQQFVSKAVMTSSVKETHCVGEKYPGYTLYIILQTTLSWPLRKSTCLESWHFDGWGNPQRCFLPWPKPTKPAPLMAHRKHPFLLQGPLETPWIPPQKKRLRFGISDGCGPTGEWEAQWCD